MMKHSSSRELYAYWNELRGARPAPERGEIEPGLIRKALGDTFVLAFDPAVGQAFRLAGTRVCALFGREVKGEPFAKMWEEAGPPSVRDILGIVTEEAVGAVVGATGRTTNGFSIELELLLLPLRHRGRRDLRMIGALTPLVVPFWVGSNPVATLQIGNVRHVGPAVEPVTVSRLADAAPTTRRGLVVHEGGRS